MNHLPDQVINESTLSHPTVFFDGVCGLCNAFVDFVMARDREQQFHFAPLQGQTAAGIVREADRTSLKSVVFADKSGTYLKSSAVIRVLWQLGGFWAFAAGCMWIIPRPVRDVGYGLVARLRYRLFGKREACRMPTPEERSRLLP